jgi:hypothetical protein
MVFSIGFVLSWIQNWNNKSKEQVLLNLIGWYGVQKYIFIRKFNEIDLCEVMIKIIVYSKEGK